MNRFGRELIANETVSICQQHYYELNDRIFTVESPHTTYYPERRLTSGFINRYSQTKGIDTQIYIKYATTLEAIQELHDEHPKDKIAALNFASGRNPGGGFLKGANAQEESLARTTSLYISLLEAPRFYSANNAVRGYYTHGIIYSSDIVVIRHSPDESLLNGENGEPYNVDIISCPAVNQSVKGCLTMPEVYMKQRMRGILAVAAKHNVKHLVLGAWGCGVFSNDPHFVAESFNELLSGEFENIFASVTFAIPDHRLVQTFNREFFG